MLGPAGSAVGSVRLMVGRVVASVRILGPIEVWADGRRVDRAVRDRSDCWPACSRRPRCPAISSSTGCGANSVGSRKRLPMAIARLRQTLAPVCAPGGVSVETVAGGYLFSLGDSELDARVFAAEVRDGQCALAAGDAQRATVRLSAALARWRGPPLAQVSFHDFAQPDVRRLEELHLTALEARIDADLQLGRHAHLVDELTALALEHPAREHLAGQLMLALYRCGRQTHALEVFHRTRAHLATELGLEPGPALQTLQAQVLAHAPELGADDRSPAPPAAAARNLPAAATPFLGRARELAEVTALLRRADTRLLTLTGAGGSGKTRLALRVAQTLAPDHGDGAWFVAFADVTVPELIAPTICQTLGLAEQPGVTPTQPPRSMARATRAALGARQPRAACARHCGPGPAARRLSGAGDARDQSRAASPRRRAAVRGARPGARGCDRAVHQRGCTRSPLG